MPTPKSLLHIHQWKMPVFLGLSILLFFYNIFDLCKENIKTTKLRKKFPYQFAAERYAGLENFIESAPFVGYFTDHNVETDTRAATKFAQAHFVLAPTILDLNNTAHEFIIFDCSTPAAAMSKIQALGAQPLKINRYGVILARNTESSIFHSGAPAPTFDKNIQPQRP